ncbi:uncharacterized protein LOC131636918 [Vicia villosa]|uniref:uncharacterized protein LOC131636918 n=1 Tax=Vicia villosa TaxID=3911 RepID=UPI00273C2702|nr:uncharacterized protein LOC131636918 [Vicia villosa]
MWGDFNVEWSYLDANGASGGILTMWKKEFFSLNFSFRGEGFLGLCMEKEGKLIYFVNVYASCDKVTRRRTWKKICEFKNNNIEGSWCIGGDFNAISPLGERIGVPNSGNCREINFFNEFIEEMDLVDLPAIGGMFTWFKSNGKAMSRLDRFLLLESFIEDWKVDGQHIGERDVSDHTPIWLKDNRKDWGPKPFKFNNLWFKHEEFDSFVEEEWSKMVVKGRGDYCLVEKLKTLKSRISWWNKSVYGWIDLKIDKDVKEMHSLDNLFIHFAGDDNTRFFHNSLKDRRRRNALCSIETRRGRMEEVTEIKDFIFKHFEGFFKEEACFRPEPHGINLNALSIGDSLDLEKPFSREEVKDAIWSCDGNKSLGPDGYSLEFFKIFWLLLNDDLMKLCNDFHLKGRSMMDGVLMVNEILNWAKRKKRGCLVLKVDFEKAYDSISWNYVRWIMGRMGFGKRWLKWMESCIFTRHVSVLVNGSATKEFKVQKGLCQGDPISPVLFVIAMEGFSVLMKKSVEVGDFKPFKYGE